MWTKEYKGYYIHGYYNNEECNFSSGNGYVSGKYKSLLSCKRAIGKLIKTLDEHVSY
jgi:hypothetical protein